MPISDLDFAEPFFTVRLITDEPAVSVSNKVIVLNLSDRTIVIREQALGMLQSAIVAGTELGSKSDTGRQQTMADSLSQKTKLTF